MLKTLALALGADAGLVLVGGAVRDRLLGRDGGDWDLATALLPEEVLRRARVARLKAIPTGLSHGTVTVVIEGRPCEITTFRGDGPYLDGRRPSTVTLGVALEADLARRDFTINAMALPIEALEDPAWRNKLVDPFGGQADLQARIIRAVGDPLQRFAEDGLRPLRACRFASQLGFSVESATLAAIPERLDVARKVAVERVFVELTKLICGIKPAEGLRLLEWTGLLDLWLPDLRPMVGCPQNRHHRHDVWEHTLTAFGCEPTRLAEIRWAILLHDAGKPESRFIGEDGETHFYGHEEVSAKLAGEVLRRLRAPNSLRDKVQALIHLHGESPKRDWSPAAFRRCLKRMQDAGVSPEEWALLRQADQFGKGWADSETTPYGNSGFEWWNEMKEHLAWVCQRLDSVRFLGITLQELALDGHALMALADRSGGLWLGILQRHLQEAVVEDPALNTPTDLDRLAREWLAKGG